MADAVLPNENAGFTGATSAGLGNGGVGAGAPKANGCDEPSAGDAADFAPKVNAGSPVPNVFDSFESFSGAPKVEYSNFGSVGPLVAGFT